MKKIAILQSNYIPWKGYFDMINMVDEFVLYDDMQYTKRDWRNRNKIKAIQGMQWISIPVATKGKFYQKICETEVISSDWVDEHWKTLQYNYARAKHFDEYSEIIKELYEQCREERYLSKINYIFLKNICKILDINTKITWSSEYNLIDGKTEKLVNICKQAGAECYLSGPAAKDYIDNELFIKENIDLEYMDYSGYKEYYQLYGEFQHTVTVLDMIFNLGKETKKYMKSFFENGNVREIS
ncbi:MAG: WbqC family protein [Lachnospiraceae bacterium]|nr:WbqC family protein [Lachnospiraceae bacterium]